MGDITNLVILGSTGSIGRQSIDVVQAHPDRLRIVGLSAKSQAGLLLKQAEAVKPAAVALVDTLAYEEFRNKTTMSGPRVLRGTSGVLELCGVPEADMVINALVGSVGLRPTLATLENGKTLCLSNKESLVAGGELVTKAARDADTTILPVDSEHSAIFQCLEGQDRRSVKRIIITASGGPFRGRSRGELAGVTVEQALEHPRWTMGAKITIDSATLMNKGLEVIEAHYLFGVPYDAIEVVVHPQSIIHSMVEFDDGSIIAQIGPTDMRIPIQYAITYPERFSSPVEGLDVQHLEDMTFAPPDLETFPSLGYCYEAGKAGKTYPAVVNSANEEAVKAFLERRIGFLDISTICKEALDAHDPEDADSVETIEAAEAWARDFAAKLILKIERSIA